MLMVTVALDDFYPRSPCGERRFQFSLLRFRFFISIHALLAESDSKLAKTSRTEVISIHALLAESDAAGVFLVILII